MTLEVTSTSTADIGVDEDVALVCSAINGNTVAFEQLIGKYDRRVMRIAQSITRTREEAEDVMQEAFVKAFQNVGAFREDARFSTWLCRIAVNEALMTLRKRRSHREQSLDHFYDSEDEDTPFDVADWAPNPEENYCTAELQRIESVCLATLSPNLRIVFVLRDIEGLSVRETADVLELGLVAVRSRLLRARLRLREKLTPYFKMRNNASNASAPAPSYQINLVPSHSPKTDKELTQPRQSD